MYYYFFLYGYTTLHVFYLYKARVAACVGRFKSVIYEIPFQYECAVLAQTFCVGFCWPPCVSFDFISSLFHFDILLNWMKHLGMASRSVNTWFEFAVLCSVVSVVKGAALMVCKMEDGAGVSTALVTDH